MMAIIGLKKSARRNKTAAVSAVKPVRPPCSTPAALSIKLVTVLVPKAAPATVPRASEIKARCARGRRLSLMNPACSATPIKVPNVSNSTMNRKTKINGSMGHDAAPIRSIFKNVGLMLGGAETRFARSE